MIARDNVVQLVVLVDAALEGQERLFAERAGILVLDGGDDALTESHE